MTASVQATAHAGALRGFSLVEISIVLVVVATMLAGVLPYVTESTKIRDTDTTAERMATIEDAIQAFFGANQFLPCPANITTTINNANFGKRATTATCVGGTPAANWGPVSNVVGGGVPTKDLGLPDEYAFDGWGRRFYYHVDTRATAVGTFNTAGAITINDSTGAARTSSAVYALVSAGRNGYGAYTRAGTVRLNNGSTNADERENCQTTGTVCTGTAAAYNATLVQKMESATNPTDPLTNFDDIVSYKLRGNLVLGGGGDTLWTASGANIYNTNSGNVGIGTTGPAAKLDVNGQANIKHRLFMGLDAVNYAWIGAQGTGTEAQRNVLGFRADPVTGLTNQLEMYLNGGPVMVVNAAGNVGIGAIAPDAKLELTTTGTYSSGWGKGIKLDDNPVLIENGSTAIGLHSDDRIMFMNRTLGDYTAATWAPSVAMTIAANGKVGIGTESPVQTLQIKNSNADIGLFSFGTTGEASRIVATHASGTKASPSAASSNYALLELRGYGYGTTGYGSDSSAKIGLFTTQPYTDTARGSKIFFETTTNNTTSAQERMTIDHNGNVGIGNTAPTYKLDVNGTARINGVVHPVSDIRLKEKIEPVADALAAVKKMRGVSYEWKDKSNGRDGRDLGLIAQEVGKIVPNLVRTANDEQHLKSLNYDGFTALFVEAIKELDGKIEALSPHADGSADAGSSAPILPNWVIVGLVAQWIGVCLLVFRRR